MSVGPPRLDLRQASSAFSAALFAASLSLLVTPANARVQPGEMPAPAATVITDFSLIDHLGSQQQMTRLGKEKAVVIISQANSCQENIDQLPKYKLLRTLWG